MFTPRAAPLKIVLSKMFFFFFFFEIQTADIDGISAKKLRIFIMYYDQRLIYGYTVHMKSMLIEIRVIGPKK